jgi:peptidoglycan/LPS O-acetylase OafA/YrhL
MVLAYHIGTRVLNGGFIGVDIFFVISGYLITKILLKELNEGRFSISAFYVRRVRRIAPALIAVLLVTTAVAYFILLPSELKDYARSLLAAVFSVSNFYFWSQSGYFDGLSLSKPLLHTWSLAVEEQFYVFFPILLAIVFRRNRNWITPTLVILAFCSFVASVWAVMYYPSLAFYWPVTRTWELMCGSCLAIGAVPAIRSAAGRNTASLAGLALICFAGMRYTSATPFPGVAALAPCIGTVLIIAAGTHGTTLVNRALALRPVVFIGLISYSLYLWHWPVVVFQAMGEGFGGFSSPVRKCLMAATALLLGTLSWRFVERPFRVGDKRTPNRKVFQVAALCAAVPVFAACVFLFGGGLKSRFPSRSIAVATYLENPEAGDRWHYRIGSCFITSKNSFKDFDQATCLRMNPAVPNYLIFGDSHAAHLDYGLSTTFPNENFLQATASGCMPFIEQAKSNRSDCVKLVDFVLKDYLPASHLKAVLIGGNWADKDMAELGQTLAYIKSLGIQPILFGPVVQYDSPLPRLLAISIKKSDRTLAERHELPTSKALDIKMAGLAKNVWDVKYISYFDTLCTGSDCVEYAAPDVPLQGDVAHFTAPGSVLFAEKLKADHAFN